MTGSASDNTRLKPGIETPETEALPQMPVPATLHKGSTIFITESNLEPGTWKKKQCDLQDRRQPLVICTIKLKEDIHGMLRAESGLVWQPSRLEWHQLGMCTLAKQGFDTDLEVLEERLEELTVEWRYMDFKLNVSLGHPKQYAG